MVVEIRATSSKQIYVSFQKRKGRRCQVIPDLSIISTMLCLQ